MRGESATVGVWSCIWGFDPIYQEREEGFAVAIYIIDGSVSLANR